MMALVKSRPSTVTLAFPVLDCYHRWRDAREGEVLMVEAGYRWS